MSSGGSVATSRRRPATGRPGGPLAASQRSQAVRMNLFVLVRILFQYLERVDGSVLNLAKEVLKDCERKHNTKDSKYQSLADAIGERVRDAVGEAHWAQARKIQKQLAVNQQKKKMATMKAAAKRNTNRMNATPAQSQELNLNTRPVSVSRERVAPHQQEDQEGGQKRRLGGDSNDNDDAAKAMEAAKAMSALSQASTSNAPSRSPSMMMDQDAEGAGSAAMGNAAPCPQRREAEGGLKIDSDEAAAGGGASSLPFRKRMMYASASSQGNGSASSNFASG